MGEYKAPILQSLYALLVDSIETSIKFKY